MNQLLAQANLGTITGPGPWGTNPDQAPANIESIASTLFGFLTIVAGLAFMLYFVLGGINWITAGGDKQKVENAKNQMTNAGIGLVIVVAAYAIVGIASTVLGIDFLNPAAIINSFPSN